MADAGITAQDGWRARAGAGMWLVQPLSVLVEVVTATQVTVSYSFAANTISDLAAQSCGVVQYPHGPVQVCSPWHPVVNASIIGFGLLAALGAVLLRRRLPPGRWVTTAVVLWVIAGAGSVATGLVPLDQDLDVHTLVSMPVILAQPAALIILGATLRRHHGGIAWPGMAAGVVSAAAAAATLTGLGSPDLAGAIERLALWPAYLWLPALAVTALHAGRSVHQRSEAQLSQ